MYPRRITNNDNIINSKDLLARIHWLEEQLNYRCSDEYSEELKTLRAFVENIEAVASVFTYERGSDLIRDSYLQEYIKAMEGSDATDASGLALSPVDFNGVVYWLRDAS
ncbi:hypothetical protein [Nitrosovibrio tenuis]|uniref:Uncharacterized protein n=1 Tax=Nitrosovibrio tenuis TaxID=1233 RepID=A0A1H7NLV2_9PROT|nr:hypothetical protein [Nitrosovibrio tenuis]SEL23975.1 hypothetical protein SAMN05216387_10752 [Nitrosovibrio tenuis]